MERVAVIFDIALDLSMLTGVEYTPRRAGEAGAAGIEIWHPCAILVEHVRYPRQNRFARRRIAFGCKPVDIISRQPVDLDDNNTLYALGLGRKTAHRRDHNGDQNSNWSADILPARTH